MLIPDNMNPELSIYYNGSIILSCLYEKDNQNLMELYCNSKNKHEMSFSIFILSLDWLYLIDIARYSDGGQIKLCL